MNSNKYLYTLGPLGRSLGVPGIFLKLNTPPNLPMGPTSRRGGNLERIKMAASLGGHVNVVEFLLSKGVDINDKDIHGSSSIMAASSQGHVNVIKLLLSKGANINDKDNTGSSSIIEASRAGHVNVVEFLLSNGADINDKDYDGSSSIMAASLGGHVNVVEFLFCHCFLRRR